MPSTAISAEQREAYERDGFIIYKNFLGDAELEEWRAALDDAVNDRGPLDHEADGALSIPQWWPGSPPEEQESTIGRRTAPDRGQHKNPNPHYSRVFTQRVNLWMTSPKMREKMLDPGLGRMVADLTGEEGVRIWVSAAPMPPPRRSLTDPLAAAARPDAHQGAVGKSHGYARRQSVRGNRSFTVRSTRLRSSSRHACSQELGL